MTNEERLIKKIENVIKQHERENGEEDMTIIITLKKGKD